MEAMPWARVVLLCEAVDQMPSLLRRLDGAVVILAEAGNGRDMYGSGKEELLEM